MDVPVVERKGCPVQKLRLRPLEPEEIAQLTTANMVGIGLGTSSTISLVGAGMRSGRALPLLWRTTKKSLLRDNQTRLETEMLERMVESGPQGTHFTVLADRGFGKTEPYECCAMLDIDYAIRFRDVIPVADAEGTQGYANEHLLPNGRPRMVISPHVTGKKVPTPAMVVTKSTSKPVRSNYRARHCIQLRRSRQCASACSACLSSFKSKLQAYLSEWGLLEPSQAQFPPATE